MVAVTIGPDGGTAYVYTNTAGLKKQVNSASHQTWTVGGLKIGWYDKPPDMPAMFDGCIDEVAVFDQKLTDDQIEQLARLGAQSFVAGSALLTWTSEVAAAETALQQQSPTEAVTTAEQKIAAYDQWKAGNPNVEGFPYQLISADLKLVLAKAKEAASADANEVAAAYTQAVCVSEQRLARRSAIAWLVAHLQPDDLRMVFADVVTNSADLASTCRVTAKQLETAGQWSALELFMDVILNRGQDVVIAAKAVDDALSAGGSWKTQYANYCATETRLEEYVVEKQCAAAEGCTAAGSHTEAAAVYTAILTDHPNTVKKAQVEFLLCKSLYKARQYASAVAKIDTFVAQYGATERRLTIEALVMKGQSLIQLGDIDGGCRAFLIVGTEYAEAAEAAEANYFVGNGRMMQSRFDEAKDAFKVVVAEYPESSYAAQAAEYITSIDSMTQ
jgi:tetratricopeptide (TPR) repeat protein